MGRRRKALPWHAVSLRDDNLGNIDGGTFDVVVVGGGINGAVSAAALAGRGISIAVIDRADFASATSQESSNLVWGGFKYLQNYELGLVAKLCRSRNRLMSAYPTRITELPFLATLDNSAPFPSWLAALGTVGYWGIGRFATRPPRFYRRRSIGEIEPIVRGDTADAAVEYGDAYLKDNDARFVWGFVRSALDRGATAANYLELDDASWDGAGWDLTLRDVETGRRLTARAGALVNAAGPHVDRLNDRWGVQTEHRIVYSKGIHLVVPRLTDSERVLAFFDDTQRLFYVIPMAQRSVIGTTDTRTTDPDEGITDDDRYFLLKQINARLNLAQPLAIEDVISERCGVRPLVVPDDGEDRTEQDWTSLSRKHEIEIDTDRRVVTVFGGKLTDCLNVGEHVVDAVGELGVDVETSNDHWYGEPSSKERRKFLKAAARVGLAVPPQIEREDTLAAVLWRRHGRAAEAIVAAVADDPSAAGPVLADSDIVRAELALYAEREMIVRLDDFLRRRTKLAIVHRPADLAADPGLDEVRAALNVD